VIITKIAVGKEGGIDKPDEYEIITSVRCYACNAEIDKSNPSIKPLVDSIIVAHSAMEASKIEEWEHEYKACPHTQKLVQIAKDFKPIDPANVHCGECELSTNLWFCLTCGHLGCGRESYGGGGGKNHAINHYKNTGHPVVVKMGTITPEGKACKFHFL